MLFCYIILHFYKYLYFISFCYKIYDLYFAGGMSLELCATLRGESMLFWSCPLICQTRRYWTDGWPSQSSVSWYPPICFWPIREGILCYQNLIRVSLKNCSRYTNCSLYTVCFTLHKLVHGEGEEILEAVFPSVLLSIFHWT